MTSYQQGQGNVNAAPAHTNTSPANQVEENDPLLDILGAGNVVAYRVDLALATGSITAGLLLSQLWYWSGKKTAIARNGWFWLTVEEIGEQLGMSYEEQRAARKCLVKLGLVEEVKKREGVGMKQWFRVNKPALYAFLREYADKKKVVWENTEDGPREIPNDQSWFFSKVENPKTPDKEKPKDRVGKLRRIAKGKVQGSNEENPSSITKTSSESSSDNSSNNSSDMSPDADVDVKSEETELAQADSEAEAPEQSLALHLWSQALPRLETTLTKPTMKSHIALMEPVTLEENTIVFAPIKPFNRNWIESRHRPEIEDALTAVAGDAITFRFATADAAGSGGATHA